MSTIETRFWLNWVLCSLSFLPAADQRKHQSSALLAFVRGIHRRPVNSPHKGPVTRKMFPFHDVIMIGGIRLMREARLAAHHWYCLTEPGTAISLKTTSRLDYVDALAQDCGNSSVLGMELPQFCAKPLRLYSPIAGLYGKDKWIQFIGQCSVDMPLPFSP